jgi:hypothetical protein
VLIWHRSGRRLTDRRPGDAFIHFNEKGYSPDGQVRRRKIWAGLIVENLSSSRRISSDRRAAVSGSADFSAPSLPVMGRGAVSRRNELGMVMAFPL